VSSVTALVDKDDERPVECDNCGWAGEAKDVGPIHNLHERVDAGGIVPAGECPECGCFAYIVKREETGLTCPKCAYTEGFSVHIDGYFELTSDQGLQPANGDIDWDEVSNVNCGSCGYEGYVGEFR
jgi:predicted nucleic-acid-binding Zn-ribbon protein